MSPTDDEIATGSFRTSIKEQGPDYTKVETSESVPRHVVQEIGVLAEALSQFGVR